MWRMLQHDHPDDYVLCTGKTHAIRDFCQIAFDYVGLDFRDYVKRDPRFYRPVEEKQLVGDPQKLHDQLDWRPKVSFEELVRMMVDADLRALKDQR
jgi:GDPmannose 4,6-dehydratase